MASFFTYSCVCDTDRTIRLTMSAAGLTMSATGLTMSGWLVDSEQEQPVTVVLILNPQAKLTSSVPFWPSWHCQSPSDQADIVSPQSGCDQALCYKLPGLLMSMHTGYLPRGTDGQVWCPLSGRGWHPIHFNCPTMLLILMGLISPCCE